MSITCRGVALLAATLLVGAGFATALGPVVSAGASASRDKPVPADFAVPLTPFDPARVAAQAAAGATIPFWSGSVVAAQDGKRYRYTMVGQDPGARLTHPKTTIVANVIPIVVQLADGTTLNPTIKSCGETVSPLNAVLASPIFNDTRFRPGGTPVGVTQYADAFQRAILWSSTSPAGVNPGYHILLAPKLGRSITIKVPASAGKVVSSVHGCPFAAVTMAYAVAQGLKLIPQVAGKPWGVTPKTFPIFLLHNVELPRKLGVSGSVGFHAAIPNPAFHGVTQTVAVASYLDAAVAPHEPDIAVLSHEVGEWMDDPLGTNSAPPWGNVGQVSGSCQRNLEVGDPLTGTTFAVARTGVIYHPQDLAFLAWFFGPSPSRAVNGFYSFNGNFAREAPACPPGGA